MRQHQELNNETHRKSGGYSLLEMILVMSAISMLSLGLFTQSLSIYHRTGLKQTLQRIESELIQAKYHSLMMHSRVNLHFNRDHVLITSEVESKTVDYIGNVFLTNPQTLTFNEHGRISKATTLVFQSQRYEQSIVIWLAQGLYEISSIRFRTD